MIVAGREEVEVLELLAIELELAVAVSLVSAPEGDRPVVLPQRAVVRDRLLVLDHPSITPLQDPWSFRVALGTRG